MIRLPLIAAVLALLLGPGTARAAEPTFADIFKRICIAETSGLDARAALVRRERFTPIELQTPQGFEQAMAFERTEGGKHWVMVLGAMTTPGRDGFPPQRGVTCMLTGGVDADIAAIESSLGVKPYAEKEGVRAYGFEFVGGRRVAIDGEDPAAVTAALSRNGYAMVMFGKTPTGGRFAVAAYSRMPGKP